MKEEVFIKAAILKTPEGVEFLAFFDFGRRLRTAEAAQDFLASIGLIASVPMTVKFWTEAGECLNLGTQDDCTKYFSDLPAEGIQVGRVSLSVETPPASHPDAASDT